MSGVMKKRDEFVHLLSQASVSEELSALNSNIYFCETKENIESMCQVLLTLLKMFLPLYLVEKCDAKMKNQLIPPSNKMKILGSMSNVKNLDFISTRC